jgi:hypothetical protein
MPILRDIPITLTTEDILANRGHRRMRQELIEQAEEAITLGQTLWQPRAVFERLRVLSVEGEVVHLAPPGQVGKDASLRVGPKADLLSDAQEVLVGVGTIGPALEKRVHELQSSGETLRSYLLDSAGVVALGAVGEALRCLAEETAALEGWGVGAALSPGSLVGWSLVGQRQVCALLPLEEIGVQLNTYSVLEPHKSFSAVIGLGPGYETAKVGSVCKYCALKKTCWRRREDPS